MWKVFMSCLWEASWPSATNWYCQIEQMGDIPLEYKDYFFDCRYMISQWSRKLLDILFADIISGVLAKSTVEQRPELNLVHVNLIKNNSTQTNPRPDSDTMWPVVARATTEDGILQKAVKAINYSRRLEATYLHCQRVNSVGLLVTRDFI